MSDAIRRTLLVGLIVGIGIAVALVKKAIHRDITSGSFYGFVIGSSPRECLRTIKSMGSVEIVTGLPDSFSSVTAFSFGRLSNSDFSGRLLVYNKKLVAYIDIENRKVTGVRFFDFDSGHLLFSIGQRAADALKALQTYLDENNGSYIVKGLIGFGPDMDDNTVQINNSDLSTSVIGENWLLGIGNWAFAISGTHISMRLTFSGNVLTRIEYWNTLVEMP